MKYSRILLVTIICLLGGWPAWAEPENSQEIADRFELLLVRSPQAGSAFDRVVEWYSTQGGGVEVLQKKWADASADPASRQSYLILQGLLAERLRSPNKARDFYHQALAVAGDPAPAARLLAALETTEGQFPAAAEAYQKALASETITPVDRIELMRSLALLYQRAFEDEKALGVWRDAMAKFPDDPYVLNEAGEAFLAAGDYASARQTFSRLREISEKDPFRKIAASLRLARTDELEGNTEAAVRTYEHALEETSEGSWINREVRGRIEELFRRKDDLPGLLAYYERRTTAVPQDYTSLAAQAEVLDQLGRAGEAVDRLRAATKLAPDNLELRLSFIRRLGRVGQADEALTEIADILKPADVAPEALLLGGNLYWNNYEATKDEKFRNLALETWQRIAPQDSSEAARIAQLAEIFASHGEVDAALAQWQRLVALSPGAVDARQRIAEIYLKRGDKAAASAVLAEIVAGDRAQPENFLALIRIQDRLEWKAEARATAQKALELSPANYEILNLALAQAIEAGDEAAAAANFAKAWENVPNEFFAEDLIKKYAVFLDRDGKGREAAEALAANLTKPLDAEVLFRLAISQQEQTLAEKALAFLKSQPDPVRAARAAAEYAQTFGTKEQQIAALQAVAQVEPRMAGESLRAVARIQAENDQTEEALKTISQLIDRTPADGSLYTLYADIASRGGAFDLAVARLREALRYVEDATSLRLQLATFLQMQGRPAEAEKVLQEAFEKEEGETRRMEIFRRQIEIATMTGNLDALVATLREKQAKEQGGARYGAYLAEIFIGQNDFLAAREELARSLGSNPDNATAIARLLDLADRGGDEEEGLRLSKRLVEIEPNIANRAAYLARLFQAGEVEEAQAELARSRADILKDPGAWNEALQAMRNAGLDVESDALVAEIVTAGGLTPTSLVELSRLHLLQRHYAEAEAALWKVVEDPAFGADLEALLNQPVAAPAWAARQSAWLVIRPLNQISEEVRNSLQVLFQPNSGRAYRSYNFGFPGGGLPSSAISPDQRARGQAFFLLSQLAQAQGAQDAFLKKSEASFAQNDVPRRVQLALYSLTGNQEGVKKQVLLQAEDAAGGIDADRLISAMGLSDPDLAAALEKISGRLEKADPQFAFNRALERLAREIGPSLRSAPDPKALADAQERVRRLAKEPGYAQTPDARIELATLAVEMKMLDLASELLEEAEAAGASQTPGAPYFAALYPQVRKSLLRAAILSNDARAEALLDKVLSEASNSASLAGSRMRGYGSVSLYAQPSGDLLVGDSEFPVLQFREIQQGFTGKAEDFQAWFAKRVTPGRLDRYSLGVFYALWMAGKKEDAVKYLEEIHHKEPSPRSAALLLESYERLDQHAKALAIIDQAAMQDGETAIVRKYRRLRLLRLAGRTDEARALAQEAAKGRLPSDIRDIFINEMNLLGVPANNLQAMSSPYMTRRSGSTDRSQVIREQIDKLSAAKKIDEAERLAIQILQRPLPATDDYREASLRSNMISALGSLKRLDQYRATLRQRLEKDPTDAETAIRLAECWPNDREAGADLVRILSTHPGRPAHLSYALQILQWNGESRDDATELLCNLLRTNPGYLAASGVGLSDRLSNTDPKIGALFAEAVVGLNEADYNALFLSTRLSGYMSELPFIAVLAEYAAHAGKPDQAIALLQRVRAQEGVGLPLVLRLAELQLAQGDAAGATATMKSLTSTKASPSYRRTQPLGMALMNLLMNPSADRDAGFIERLIKLAERTGTLDLILQSMDAEAKERPGQGISPALLVRTRLGRRDTVKEWRKIARTDISLGNYVNLPMLGSTVRFLAQEEDAAGLISALVRKVPDYCFMRGPDETLSYFADVLPILAGYPDNAELQKHLNLALSKSMQGQNLQYFARSESYSTVLNLLLDYGYTAQARKLLDATADERSRNSLKDRFSLIEARLSLAEGRGVDLRIVCAGLPIERNRLRVSWKVGIDTGDRPNAQRVSAAWSETKIVLPKRVRPVELEIYAGANAVTLERIARVENPATAGLVEGKMPAPLGILQARWKLADGSVRSGPLTAYVSGENLIARDGLPADSQARDSFKTGQPGPLGKSSAVSFKMLSMRSEYSLPLVSLETGEGASDIIVFLGWLKSSLSGNTPQVEVRTTQEDGDKNRESVFSGGSAPGEWWQVTGMWSSTPARTSVRRLSESVKSLDLSLLLRASGNYNMQMQIEGGWDGLQLVRIKQPDLTGQIDELLKKARAGLGSGASSPEGYSEAADAYLEAIRLAPAYVFEQGSSLVEAFQKSNRMEELFSLLSSPALYLPNPLQQYSATLQSEGIMASLIKATLQPDAPKSAATWLRAIENAPLRENLRYMIDFALLRERVRLNPASVAARDFLATLGFGTDGIDRDRVHSLWSWNRLTTPTEGLLRLAEERQLAGEMLTLLQDMHPPVETLPSKQVLELWLKAPTDPKAALEIWRQATALQKSGQGSLNINDDASRAIFARLAQYHSSPGDLVAAMRTWSMERNNGGQVYAQRQLIEMLYAIAKTDGPQKAAFTSLWIDEEISALQNPSYQAQRERTSELVQQLLADQNWPRLENLLSLAEKNESLRSSGLNRDSAQLRELVDFAQGKRGKAWPVVWCEPGTNAQKVKVCWRWNIRGAEPGGERFGSAIAVVDKPLTPQIAGQKSVEIQFGAMPSEMQPVGKVDGDKAEGSLEVDLPSANGFLRVISVFENERVSGPVAPVISGRRIYPEEGMDLEKMLTMGSRPFSPSQIAPAGQAPDGSPAVWIKGSDSRSFLSYMGPSFPVKPDRFYVGRIWIRRAGMGTVTATAQYKAAEGTDRGTLNLVLSERPDATTQWMLFTRAIPSFPQHTFWIPYQKVESMSLRLGEVNPDTEIAGFEIYDVENWKYGQWLGDLARLRENAGKTPDAATVENALQMAAVEPLTALDYHGDWLTEQAITQGKVASLLDLYRIAFAAEPNPLFARPKFYRIFSALMKVADAAQLPAEVRLSAVQLAIDNAAKAQASQRFLFQRKLFAVHPTAETTTSIRQDLLAKLQDPEKGGAYLSEALSPRTYVDDRPVNEFVNLVVALQDPETVHGVIEQINGKPGQGLDENERIFITLALQASLSPLDASANEKIADAFTATRNNSSTGDFMFWASLLGESLAAQGKSPEVLMALRRAGFDRVREKSKAAYNDKLEFIRAAGYLLETSIAQGDKATTEQVVAKLVAAFPPAGRQVAEPPLRLVLRSVVQLANSGNQAAVDQLVRALEKDIQASPKMKEAFAPYLPKHES